MNEIEASSLHMNSLMYGFLIGLVLAVIIYIREIFKRRSLNKELKSLRKHLHQKLEIDAESMTGRQKEIEQLKKANENLRVTNKTLSQKPGRTEVLNYHIYQKAINYMAESIKRCRRTSSRYGGWYNTVY